MSKGLAGYSVASYDPAGTIIRLSYDPDVGRNLLDDPSFVHEMAHYGQNIMTGLGIEQTLMSNELFYATAQILASEPNLVLPLSKCKPAGEAALHWEIAELTQIFQNQVIGELDLSKVIESIRELKNIRPALLSATHKPGASNPFFFLYKGRGPGFGVKYGGEAALFFCLNGQFVQEIHSRTTEFITRWAHEQLDINDAVTYFLFSQNNPVALLYLAVSKLITERLGEGIYDVQDSVFLCHLCAQIALNGYGLNVVSNLPWSEIGTARIKFRYRAPGDIFLRVLAAALDQFVRPGWAVERYFDLMTATLSKLVWPQFDQMMKIITDELLAGLSTSALEARDSPHTQKGGYQDYLSQKWEDCRLAIAWMLDLYRQQNVMDFVRAPLLVVTDGITRGPVIAGPGRYSIITSPEQASTETPKVPPELMRGLLVAFITHKLWCSHDLTCLEPAGSPLQGSAIGCEHQARCQMEIELGNQKPVCINRLWLQVLERYPGLSSKISEQGWLSWQES